MERELRRPSENTAPFRAVLALARRAKRTVGFLQNEAFSERARRGTLIAAIVGGEVAGYLLYDLPRDEIRVVHLVVADQYRGRGLARQMVEDLAQAHPSRRGILLSCRNDFEADRMWPKLDFVAVGERPGRSVDGKPLTRWFRSFGQPDLFTALHEVDRRPVAILDSCVFFEVVSESPNLPAEQLRADWLGEHVRLSVADHLLNEIHRGKDQSERRRQTIAAEPFRLPAVQSPVWRTMHRRLIDAHPNAPEKDQDDLVQLAQAIAAQATWLVTDDKRFRRLYSATGDQLGGLRLRSSAAFLREIDELARGDRYRPIDLADTAVSRREADAESLPSLAHQFVNHPAGERIRDLQKTIELVAADPDTTRMQMIEVDGTPRGLVCWRVSNDVAEVPLIRATTGIGESTIGRHLLGLVRDEASSSGVSTIRIGDLHPSLSVERSYRDEGFAVGSSGAAVANPLNGEGSISDLAGKADAVGSPLTDTSWFGGGPGDATQRAAEAERWFAPFRVLNAGIPSFVVPIQHGWATNLLDAGLAQNQLFPRPWGLGLRRELVYYRSSRNSGGLIAPARLLWYVSGTGPGAGTIRAVSHLEEVIVDDYRRLFHRFRSLGVYKETDVAARADARGIAMALRFGNTARFRTPVTLDQYRELVSGNPKSKKVVLRSVRRIPEHMFVKLIEMGSGRAG